jgi:hypothetical protein
MSRRDANVTRRRCSMYQLSLLMMVQFGVEGRALAEGSKLEGETLRQAVSGRTVLIATPIGSFPIRYKSNGTMTGRALAAVENLKIERDGGRWWIADDRLCQRWHQWLDAKQYCFKLQRAGTIVHWLRDDGLSGTAIIREPVMRLR